MLFAAHPEARGSLLLDYGPEGVVDFFSKPTWAVIGWLHYLAFDLRVATWEVEVADEVEMSSWLLVPLTFAAGPIELVLFTIAIGCVRWNRRRLPTSA